VDKLVKKGVCRYRVPAQTTFPWATENGCVKAVPGQNERHDHDAICYIKT